MLCTGFVTGLFIDTSSLKNYLLFATVLMIYPTMIGIRAREIFDLSHYRLILTASAINFVAVPALAYFLGIIFLKAEPQLFAGLIIASLLPTSNMTIAFTLFAGGNVPAAVKLMVISLVAGSLVAPWYLLVMIGKYIEIDMANIIKIISCVVFIPLALGFTTYYLFLKKFSQDKFNDVIKPLLPAFSAWGAVYVIFTGASTNARLIVSQPKLLVYALAAWVVFYAVNYFIAIKLGRRYFNRQDTLTLIFGTVLRNLAISIGLAATAFGVRAALMVSLAFLFQGQSAAWFIRLDERYKILPESSAKAGDI
jgi:predicted Na+-dependent transporter